VLPILRSLNKVYGPISVIHFDAHLDTWAPGVNQSTAQSRITHGSFFYIAREEGLLSDTNVHAGIRCKMSVRPPRVHNPSSPPLFLLLPLLLVRATQGHLH
jgi:agmatinase